MSTRPWFPFYIADWLISQRVRGMSLAARGLYADLLARAWEAGSIPADLDRLAKVQGISRRELDRLWPEVAPCWEETSPGRLTNARQEAERTRADRVSEKRAAAGKKGARATNAQRHTDGNSSANADGLPEQTGRPGPPQSHPQSHPQETHPPTPRTRGDRGTRVPEPFPLDDALTAFAWDLGFRGRKLEETVAEFVDYWRGVPGAKGRKLDWPATFKNRLRDLASRRDFVPMKATEPYWDLDGQVLEVDDPRHPGNGGQP